MRLGLIVRADDRGLGLQSWEMYRALKPTVTVCVDISPIDPNGKWPQHFDRYPDAIVSPWAGYLQPLSQEAVDALLGCDLIFTIETTYDPKLFELARQRGVATVIYVNPELWRPHETEHATAVWAPSTWRLTNIPRAEYVPMPVALDRFADHVVGDGFLHVCGHRARLDRNGTEHSIRASRYAQIPLTVTVQDQVRMAGRGINQVGYVADYWRLYDGSGVLVMPRKYGGLSLPVQEAMACGMAVVMPDCSPNTDWPVSLVPCRRTHTVKMPGGDIPTFDVDLTKLAQELVRMKDPDYRGEWQAKSRAWAQTHSWQYLRAEWLARLAELG